MATFIATAAGQSPIDRFFDEYYFPYNPTTATSSGIHKYDGKLEDYSKAGNATRIASLKKFEREISKLPPDADRDLVLSYIHASLLELETIRMWEKNPDLYSSGISSSAFTIMSRTFAPPEVRSQIADRARAPDAQGSGRGPRERPESSQNLHRNRDRAASRHNGVF
jgi:hypothetical protein